MSNELLEEIERVLPSLESIREELIQTAVTKSNRQNLDDAYIGVVDAIRTLTAMAAATQLSER